LLLLVAVEVEWIWAVGAEAEVLLATEVIPSALVRDTQSPWVQAVLVVPQEELLDKAYSINLQSVVPTVVILYLEP
jgi:hypothetical protein